MRKIKIEIILHNQDGSRSGEVLKLTEHDITFKVKKSAEAKNNSAEIEIYNLLSLSRLSTNDIVSIFVDDSIIYAGTIVELESSGQTDILTKIKLSTGVDLINTSFNIIGKKGETKENLIKRFLDSTAYEYRFYETLTKTFATSVNFFGDTQSILEDLLNGEALKIKYEDNTFIFYNENVSDAVEVTKNFIKKPNVKAGSNTINNNSKTMINFVVPLDKRIRLPFVKLVYNDEDIKIDGVFNIDKIEHIGSK